MLSILTAIQKAVLQNPTHPAYRVNNELLTFGKLWHLSDCVAQYLVTQEFTRQQPIVVYGHMSPLQLVAFLGAVKAGHPYIPIDSSTPSERLQLITQVSGACLLLTTEDIQTIVTIPVVAMTELLAQTKNATTQPATWVRDDEIYYIIYTSGSTGNPKGVQISASNLAYFVTWMEQHFPVKAEGVFLNQAPYSFDLSVMDLYPALVGGHTLYAITHEQIANPKYLFEQLAASGTRVWTSTPSFAKMCLMNKDWNQALMPKLNTFLFCGEVLPKSMVTELMLRFPQATIFNLYGPTETTVAVSFVEVTKEMLQCYEQLPIASITESNLSLGANGEIMISGPTVSAGYLGAPDLTQKAFPTVNGTRIYKTGDVGYEKDGYLFFAGRADFQVKLHGYRLELEEIEKKIENLALVSSCVVVPVKQGEEVVSLSAYIVLGEPLIGKAFQMTKHLKSLLADHLPTYMIPKKFIYIDHLPLNTNGKVNRKELAVLELV